MIDATRSTHNQEIVNSYVTGYNKGKLDSKIEFIEKACKWLLEGGYFVNNTETIDNFKQAMEE